MPRLHICSHCWLLDQAWAAIEPNLPRGEPRAPTDTGADPSQMGTPAGSVGCSAPPDDDWEPPSARSKTALKAAAEAALL